MNIANAQAFYVTSSTTLKLLAHQENIELYDVHYDITIAIMQKVVTIHTKNKRKSQTKLNYQPEVDCTWRYGNMSLGNTHILARTIWKTASLTLNSYRSPFPWSM